MKFSDLTERDKDYLITAMYNMLGENGKKVVDTWVDKGVRRAHIYWGDTAHEMTGEERSEVLLNLEKGTFTPMTKEDFGE